MKLIKIVLILTLLSSCIVPDKKREDSINIHFLNPENSTKFEEKQPYIEEIVRETIELCRTAYPLEDVDIYIRNQKEDFLIIPFQGIGGRYVNNNAIQVVMNIDFDNLDFMLKDSLPKTILHELGHVIHFRNSSSDYTLFKAIVSEGIADHFEMSLTKGDIPPWSSNLSEQEIPIYMELAKNELWSTNFDFTKWFFDFNGKYWVSYSLGYKIVGEYMAMNPSKTAVDVAKLSDKEIYNSISYLFE